MSQAGSGVAHKDTRVFQLAKQIFNIKQGKSSKNMSPQVIEQILDSFVIGVQMERSKIQPENLNNIVQEIVQDLKHFEHVVGQVNVLTVKRNLYDTFLFNSELNLRILIQQETKVQRKQIEDLKAQAELQKQRAEELKQIQARQIQIQIEEQQSALLIKQMMEQFQQEDDQDKESVILVRQMQQQFEDQKRLLDLKQKEKALREQEELKLKQPTDCSICMTQILYEDRWPLNVCGHIYHRDCLAQYFADTIKNRKFPLKCPEQKCLKEVQYEDLTLILDEETLTQYNQFTLASFIDLNPKDMSWCPTAGCSYAFVFEQGDSQFNCPKCKKHYCLNCRVDFHVGQTCAQFRISTGEKENDKLFDEFVQGSKMKKCPQCKFWVEKSQGCNHMTCRCKNEFCYLCGGPYPKCLCIV